MSRLNTVTGKDQVDLLNQFSEDYLYDDISLSREFSEEAFLLSDQLDYKRGKGQALLNRGKIAFLNGKFSQSIQLLDSALQVAQALEGVEWEGDIYRWLARSHEEMNELDKSISCYQSYFDHYNRFNDLANMALALTWQGEIFHRLGRIKEARDHYQQALQYFNRLKNQRGKFITLIKLAMLELDSGNQYQAYSYFQRIDQISAGIDDQDLLLTYFQSKAAFYEQTFPDSSLFFLFLALGITEKDGKSFSKLSLLKEISDLYTASGENDLADRYNQEYSRLYDSLFGNSQKPSTELSGNPLTQSDSLAHEPADDSWVLGTVSEKRTHLGWIIAGFVFLVLSLIFFMWNLYRFRKVKIHPAFKHAAENKSMNIRKEPVMRMIQTIYQKEARIIKPRSDTKDLTSKEEEDHHAATETPERTKSVDPYQLRPQKEDQEIIKILGSKNGPAMALDENLNVKFVNKALYELLQYRKGELNGVSIDLLLKENEEINEMIFKKITRILENGENDEIPRTVPIVFKNKSRESCHLYGILSIYQKETELLILFYLFTRQPDLREKKEDRADLHGSFEGQENLYHSQGLKKKEYLTFVFNRHLTSIYQILDENQAMVNIQRSDFYLDDKPGMSDSAPVNTFKIYEQVKHVLKKNTNDGIRFHEEIKNDEIHTRNIGWIYALLYIILENAIESIKESGDIYFISEMQNSQYQIKVVDTGEGMSFDLRKKAFKPFFTTKAFPANQGLGLSVAREIMLHHRGVIKIRSNFGRGTEVILEFPRE